MKRRYNEGDVFIVPLQNDRYSIGLIARRASRGPIILCYFFDPQKMGDFSESKDVDVHANEASLIAFCGAAALQNGSWPIIGSRAPWTRDEWPVPAFIHHVPGVVTAMRYYDENSLELIREEVLSGDALAAMSGIDAIPKDGLSGVGSIEKKLDRMMAI